MTAIAVTDDGLRVLTALDADYDPDYLGDNHIALLFASLLPRLLTALNGIRKDLRIPIRLNSSNPIVSQRKRSG